MPTKTIEKYFFYGLLFVTLLFTFFIFRPFLIVLVLGISFAVVLYPVYTWFKNRKLPNSLSAFLTVLVFIVALGVPLFGIGALVFNQSQDVYKMVVDGKNTGPFVNSIGSTINRVMPAGLTFDIEQKTSDLISFISRNVATIFSSTLFTLFLFVIMLLSIFYFLKDGLKWRKDVIGRDI